MSDYIKTITLSRDELQKVLNAFDQKSEQIHFCIEINPLDGDRVLWVDNGKFGNHRAYIRINKPSGWKD